MLRACRHWGISRQAHYAGLQRQQARQVQADQVVSAVQGVRIRQPRLGTRKLHHLLHPQWQAAGAGLGRDALFDLLRQRRLLVPRQRAYHKTTDSHHHYRRHPNLLKTGADQVIATAAEQVWVADITYLPTGEGKPVYLSLVTDAYSRKIVGWQVHDSLHAEPVGQALKRALSTRTTRQPLVHHSDRGIQYASDHYQRIHQKQSLTCSMTDGYDCYQNALAERVNGILKGELLLHRPQNLEQARTMVKESIAIYNGERPHLALKMKTPNVVHRASVTEQLRPKVYPPGVNTG